MTETSVVIRSFNEADTIERVLDAVEAQAYRDFEVVLVDSGSTDGTLDVAAPRVDTVVEIDPRDFTFGYSLNVGCDAAEGRFLAFLSAHAIPTDEHWLGPMVENLRDDDVAMTYSRQRGVESTKLPEERHFKELFPDERKVQTPPDYFANNASSAIEKSLWEQHQFDEYLTGLEDIEWAKHFMDRGYVVVYEPEACIYHIHDESWEQVFTRFEREAIAAREIGVRSPGDAVHEYARLPVDIVGDVLAAVRRGELDGETLRNVLGFRFHQRRGAATGLRAEPELQENRYEFFYGGANEHVVVSEPGVASVEREPLPAVKPNDVLLAVTHVGVSDDDLALYHGESPPVETDTYPVTPGREYVGRVVDAGANVDRVAEGEVVVGEATLHCETCEHCTNGDRGRCPDRQRLGIDVDGSYSHYLVVPSDHVHAVPSSLTHPTATLARPLATVLDGLERVGGLQNGQSRVAVLGGGLLGNLSASLLASEGSDVTVFEDRSTFRDALPSSVHARGAAAGQLTAFDLVLETGGSTASLDAAVGSAAPRVVLLGAPYPDESLTADGGAALDRDVTVATVVDPSPSQYDAALDRLTELRADGLTGQVLPFEEYERAWAAADRELRTVLSVNGR
ncbi:glycosyltransferase [Haloarchaeobius litoreus]|uniref:Glycosyltransferase n=1 Tax=Haloarchaeobius litoreus TaxID=755306 RepID=A0ABD6DN08_9EURY|nr:alcohol dehydrogenase catalytic domain-containing protein [Haloarchaeobius litoreus]